MTDQPPVSQSSPAGRTLSERPNGPNSPPWMSLILATYGRSAELSVVLESLLAQTETGFELIVVDQNVDNRLDEVLAKFPTLLIRHLRQSEANLSLARNLGLEQANGEWVAFPDDDCWYEPDCLQQVRQALAGDPHLDGVVGCWVEVEGPSVRPPHELQRSDWRDFRGGDASSITLFLKRDPINELAGFDTRIGVGQYFGAGEETDLLLRLLDRGHRLQFLPAARVHHHFSDVVPPLSMASWRAVLKRARGVGAIYAKHRLSAWVVLRGLVAPLINPLRSAQPFAGIAFGLAAVIGRSQGLLSWRAKNRGEARQ